jgi:hypothetical protein
MDVVFSVMGIVFVGLLLREVWRGGKRPTRRERRQAKLGEHL